MKAISLTDSLQNSLQPLKKRLADHALYRCIETLPDLRIFMEHHIFAVWDFMSLLKTLQRRLTCVTVPWLPGDHPLTCRLINEIVLEEESDTDTSGGYISHFELYRSAMAQCGASTSEMDAFLAAIRRGNSIDSSLACAQAPKAAREFVKTTMRIIESESTHAVAAAFTLGREDVIPMMFQPLVVKLAGHFPGELTRFQDYLDRHIKLDEERHTPMALRMLVELCGEDPDKWQEAGDAARVALIARIVLWDGVIDQISLAKCRQTLRDIGNPVPSSGLSTKPECAIRSAPLHEG
jgi:hypothetical protein